MVTIKKAIEEINQRDISVDVFTKGDEINLDAVIANINAILLTRKGELHRDIGFGCRFMDILHNTPDNSEIRIMMEEIYDDLEILEPNIRIDRQNTKITFKSGTKAVYLVMPFTYIKYNTQSKFVRKFTT